MSCLPMVSYTVGAHGSSYSLLSRRCHSPESSERASQKHHRACVARMWPTCDPGAAANALGDVVAGHLQVQAARDGAALLVHVEERLHLLPAPLA